MSDTDKDPNEAMADEWAEALEEQADQEAAASDDAASGNAAPSNAESAQFQQLHEDRAVGSAGDPDVNLEGILDIPVTISMEIGRTNINIRNLLQLNQGSVVELDRLAGEPMDVLVNGTLIAQGEVVVVNEKFGIRLTDVISPSERVKRLGK